MSEEGGLGGGGVAEAPLLRLGGAQRGGARGSWDEEEALLLCRRLEELLADLREQLNAERTKEAATGPGCAAAEAPEHLEPALGDIAASAAATALVPAKEMAPLLRAFDSEATLAGPVEEAAAQQSHEQQQQQHQREIDLASVHEHAPTSYSSCR